jgi:uncharacterized membrane protein YfcA
LDFVTSILLVLLGVFSGFLGGLLGVGGGIIVVPILILAFDLQAQQAVGTSLVMIIFTALSATFAYSRQRRLDWKVGIMGALVTVPGAAIGAYVTKFLSSTSLTILFSVFLFFIAASMVRRSYASANRDEKTQTGGGSKKTTGSVWKRSITDAYGNVFQYEASIYTGLALLFVGGLASGFFGIGGGLIVVPILASVVGLPMHIAVATSMLTMIFTSISGVATHIMLGHVLLEYAAPIIVGIVIGAQLGARTAKRLRSISLERVFAAVVFIMGILLIVTRR